MNQVFFPMFVDISDKKILIVGGGAVAARRVKTLLLFTDEVTVLSPSLCDELKPLPEGVRWISREYGAKCMPKADVVPRAVDGAWEEADVVPRSVDGAWEEADVVPRSVDGAVTGADVVPRAVDGAWTGVDAALPGTDVVLAATNRTEVNQKVFADCRWLESQTGRRILVNCADDKERCDFFFPAVVQSGEITVGINSGGRDVKKVRKVRERIQGALWQ